MDHVMINSAKYSCAAGHGINEDSCLCSAEKGIFIVADGLGGHSSGEIASLAAVNYFEKNCCGDYTDERLGELLEGANREVAKKGAGGKTTVAAAFTENGNFIYANVGDSRVYYFRNGKLIAQTKDHSVCQASVDMGMMRAEEIRGSEDRSRLLKVLGSEEKLKIKKRYQPIRIQNGDAFLVCSDGFWEYVLENEMEADLQKSESPEVWLKFMLERHIPRAENKGDNYTAICGIIYLDDSERHMEPVSMNAQFITNTKERRSMVTLGNETLCLGCFSPVKKEPCPHCGFSAAEYEADPLVLPIGTRLGDKIIIGKVMGKGGFGITYLGYDLGMKKVVAVKEYYPNGIAYRSPSGAEVSVLDAKFSETFEEGVEKFYAEAQMVARFNENPNIVSVYDYFRANNTVYLVMEYLNGITLKNYVKTHGTLSDRQALFAMDKIAAALCATHSEGVLHRDISPDNIMICMDGEIKLIDFGAARQIMEKSSSNLTVVMKPGYTPIEQYTKKGRQGAWTDLYSLGAAIYYALTEVIIDDPYARLDDDSEFAENKHGINNDLWEVLKKCTKINASDRYGSADDLRKALSSVSAPIKSEPILLADDRGKPDEHSADSGDKEKPEEHSADSGDIAEGRKSSEDGHRKSMIAGICAAAFVVIISVIGIFVAIRSEETAAGDSKSKTAKTSDMIRIDDDDRMWSASKAISKTILQEINGDIRVSLELSPVDQETTEEGHYDRTIRITDGGGTDINVNALAVMRNGRSEFEVNDGVGNFVFIISQNEVDSLNDNIFFSAKNVSVESAVLEKETAGKIINFDGKYAGDFGFIKHLIPIGDLTDCNSDVRITLDLEVGNAAYYNGIYGYDDRGPQVSFIRPRASNWKKVDVSADNISDPEKTDGMYRLWGEGERKFSFTISRNEIEELEGQDLGIVVYNLVIKRAYIKSVAKDAQ